MLRCGVRRAAVSAITVCAKVTPTRYFSVAKKLPPPALGLFLYALISSTAFSEFFGLFVWKQSQISAAFYHNQLADFELFGEAQHIFLHIISPQLFPFFDELFFRQQEFGGHLVAELFNRVCSGVHHFRVCQGAISQKDMYQFMYKGKDLRIFTVIAIDEEQRRIFINQNEASELLDIQAAMRVVDHHGITAD